MGNTLPSIEAIAEDRLLTRFQAMLTDMNALAGVAQSSLLGNTISELSKFAQAYYDFVDRCILLQRDKEFLHKRHSILEKIQREWMGLRPLVFQRFQLQDPFSDYIQVADAIATDCVVLSGIPEQPCLTYFQKVFSIARFAYSTRVPSVAIPLDVWTDPWHWMGLGHEIGHYIFWNHPGHPSGLKSVITKELYARFLAYLGNEEWECANRLLPLWYEWVEEIFADILGALILGPAYIRSLIAWMCPRLTADSVRKNDHDHPIALLRPLIQVTTLNKLEGDVFDANSIISDWEEYWKAQTQSGVSNGDLRTSSSLFDLLIEGVPKENLFALIDIVATTVVDITRSLPESPRGEHTQLGFYTAALHRDVMAKATQLSRGETPSPIRPALRLSVAWYAWELIMSDTDISQREYRLNHVREWVGVRAQTFQSQSAKPASRDSFITFLNKKNLVDQEVTNFARRVFEGDRLQPDDLPKNISALLDELLRNEFSTEEFALCDFCQRVGCAAC